MGRRQETTSELRYTLSEPRTVFSLFPPRWCTFPAGQYILRLGPDPCDLHWRYVTRMSHGYDAVSGYDVLSGHWQSVSRVPYRFRDLLSSRATDLQEHVSQAWQAAQNAPASPRGQRRFARILLSFCP